MSVDWFRGIVDDLVSGEQWVGTGMQLWCSIGEREIDVTSGTAVPGGPMRSDTLHKVWCATKPVLALALGRVLEDAEVPTDRDLAALLGPIGEGVTFQRLLEHQADLTRPRMHELLITPPHLRRQMIESALDDRRREVLPPGYSEVSAPFLMARAFEALTGRPADTACASLIADTCGTDAEVVLSIEDRRHFADLRDRIGVFVSPRSSGSLRPWLHDRTFTVALTDTAPALGGYASARGLGQLWRAVLDQVTGVRRHAALPSATFLRHQLDNAGSIRPDAVLGRDCGFALGCQTGLADHGLGRRPSPRSFGHVGLFGSCFAFADPDVDLVLACVANGLPTSSESIDGWRSALVDGVYHELV